MGGRGAGSGAGGATMAGRLRRLAKCGIAMAAAVHFAELHPALSSAIAAAFEPAVPSRPSFVVAEGVSQKYPSTLMNKLFSSVPKREYAVRDINLSFGHGPMSSKSTSSSSPHSNDRGGLTLLVGRSASGKSTLLRLLAGMERPTSGCVAINGHRLETDAEVGEMPRMPPWAKMGMPTRPKGGGVQPVILQGKPDFDDSLPVMERMVRVGCDAVDRCSDGWNGDGSSKEETSAMLRHLAADFASLLTLSEGQHHSPPSGLSPSGQYLFGIACGCMMSVAPSAAVPSAMEGIERAGIHYPILFFDELFDAEHPGTVEKCSRGILNLIGAGAVVVSSTHRPGYFEGLATRTITLSGGRVLTDEAAAIGGQDAGFCER